MPRRSLRRPRKTRTVGKKIVIVCEGAATEIGYFNAIRISKHLPKERIPISHEGCTDPLSIVQAAVNIRIDLMNDRNWINADEIWAVYDGDEHISANLARWNQALNLASRHNIKLAVSNPSFEFWYLLHFQEQNANLTRRQAYNLLRRHLNNYEKPNVLYPMPLKAKTSSAIGRARRLIARIKKDQLEFFNNPSTYVFELVENLLKIK